MVDPDGTLSETHRQFERRYLTLSPLLDGMTTVDGLLDPEAAELLDAALQPYLTPVGPTDTRTTAQRRLMKIMPILLFIQIKVESIQIE